MVENQRGSAPGVTIAVIALIVGLVSLALSWTAYNRTGEDLENQIQREVDSAINQTEQVGEDAVNEVEQAGDEAAQELDEGPDNVDEDETNSQQNSSQ